MSKQSSRSRKIGLKRSAHLAEWVKHKAPGSVGYIVLGFLLGTVRHPGSALCRIPIEVRDVTLSAASLGYALMGFGSTEG